MTMTRRGFLLAVAALLGITVAAALTWSVSRLSGQRIGLLSEPPSVIHGLAPPHAPSADRTRKRVPSHRATGRPLTTSSAPAATPPVSLPTASSPVTPSPVAPPPATAAPVTPRSNASDHHDDSGGSVGAGSGASHAARDD